GEEGPGRMPAVAGQAGCAADPEPLVFVEEVHEDIENQRQCDAHPCPPQRLLRADHVCLAVEYPQVEGKHQQDEDDESDPQNDHEVPQRVYLKGLPTYRMREPGSKPVSAAALWCAWGCCPAGD